MEAFEAILTRRSIRQYTDQEVPEEMIKKLLEAAMSAPSAKNYQPWHFIVVREKELLREIPRFHPYADMLKRAPLGIMVLGDVQSEAYKEYISLDCSAATVNVLLAAKALGLGAVWLGVYPVKDRMEGFTRLFNIPSHIIPISFISIGFPAEEKPRENRYDSSKIHYEKW